MKFRLLLLLIILMSACAPDLPASAENEQLAKEVLSIVIDETEKVWNRTLDKEIELTLVADGSESDRQYPMLWSETSSTYSLSLHEDFDLDTTWWNMQPDNQKVLDLFRRATLRQKYILVISHEVSHLLMATAPMKPWFQEAAAMNIGKQVAVTIDPSLIDAFPEPIDQINNNELYKYSYLDMINSIDTCRKVQYASYSLTYDLPVRTLIEWVNQVEEYDVNEDDKIYDLLSK